MAKQNGRKYTQTSQSINGIEFMRDVEQTLNSAISWLRGQCQSPVSHLSGAFFVSALQHASK
jgi:hypothetical protein